MAGTPPNYDNVQMPGGDGIRIPTEVLGANGAGKPGATMATYGAPGAVNLGSAASYTLSAAQTQASQLTITNGSAAATVNVPGAFPDKQWILFNNSGTNVTLKVTGQTGITVATGKRAILVGTATDVARVTADT